MLRHFNRSCIPILLLLLVFPLRAQNPVQYLKMRRLNVEDGLSHADVTSIIQDRLGFMWFGARDGLNKYDGYKVTVFTKDVRKPGSLTDSHITALEEDDEGYLWVGTLRGGLHRFHSADLSFTNYRHHPENPNTLGSNHVLSLYCDQKGVVWVGADNGGLHRFRPETDDFIRYNHNPSLDTTISQNSIYVIEGNSKGYLWLGNLEGLDMFDVETGLVKRFHHDKNNPDSINDTWVYSLLRDEQDLWVGTQYGGLNRYLGDNRFKHFKPDWGHIDAAGNVWIKSILKDRFGAYWVGLHLGGLSRFDPKTGVFTPFRQHEDDLRNPSHNKITQIYEDRSGMIWVATDGAGVASFDPSPHRFSVFTHHVNDPYSLSHPSTTSLLVDSDQTLWVGTADGLNKFDRGSASFQQFQFHEDVKGSLQRGMVSAIVEHPDGGIYIGTMRRGVSRFDPEANRFTHFYRNTGRADSLTHDRIHSLYVDSRGFLWVGTEYGLCRFDSRTQQFKKYRHVPEQANTVSSSLIQAMLEDSQMRLWLGGPNGLNRYVPEQDQFYRVPLNSDLEDGLLEPRITAIYQDSQERIWLGTYGGGLVLFDAAAERYQHVMVEGELANNVVCGILEDRSGFLWISTHQGLSRYDADKNEIVSYTAGSGLAGNQFNPGAYVRDQTGALYFGGRNGLTFFDPDSLRSNPFAPEVVITDFRLANDSVAPAADGLIKKEITHTDSITLSWRDDMVSFSFAGLHYQNPRENQYAYKLENFHDHWITTDSANRNATFTDLDHGHYRFRVKAANREGVWSEQGASIDIYVTPPYWRSWWFQVLMVLLIMAVLFGVYRLRIGQLLRLERLRTRIASDLHDDIGGVLTHIAMDTEWMLMTKGMPEQALTRTQRIGHLAREAIQSFGDIIWSIDSRNDNTQQLIRRIRDAAHGLLSSRDIRCQFEIEGFEESKPVSPDVRQHIFLICKEAFNNIAKHAQASEVHIQLVRKRSQITICIRDNGQGFSGAGSSGHGMRNMRMRAKKLGGELSISDQDGVCIDLVLKV